MAELALMEVISLVAAGTTVTSFVMQQQAAGEARSAQARARGEQEKIQSEQKAQNAAAAAAERRAQIREERVRRARVMQGSAGTGAAFSSGEFGALGALGTNLASNIGTNVGKVASSERTSGYAQQAATFMGEARNAESSAQQAARLFSLSGTIFGATKGVDVLKKVATVETPIDGF